MTCLKWFVLLLVVALAAESRGQNSNEAEREKKITNNTREMDKYESVLDKIWIRNKDINIYEDLSDIKEVLADTTELMEGDIVLTKRLAQFTAQRKTNPGSEDSPFDAILNGQWPRGVVPYTFRSGFSYRSVALQAMREISARTCITFRPTNNREAHVEFMHGGGCYSMIGRQGGRQQISLGSGCGQLGVAIHEIMHALGFFHEQSRRDRDGYITINFGNIRRSMWYNFEKYRQGQASTLGEPYDKKSVMHYGNYAFSTNGQKTIISKSNPSETLGQRQGLSNVDVRQLNKYYKCSGTGGTRTTTTRRPRPVTNTVRPTTVIGCRDDVPQMCPTIRSLGLCSYQQLKNKCKKTCRHASCNTQQCKDNNRNCRAWASGRFLYCRRSRSNRYYDYMKNNCKKSCKMC